MSYNISLKQLTYATVADIGSYTYNIQPMFRRATGQSLSNLSGMKASDAQQVLQAALDKMQADPQAYRALNPANGWGHYNGFVTYLSRAIRACRLNPDADFVVG